MKLSDLPKLKPLIEAVERGEAIQVCQDGIWIDCKGYNYEFMDWQFDYRIKPKPREWYIVAEDSDDRSVMAHSYKPRTPYIKVREVLDD